MLVTKKNFDQFLTEFEAAPNECGLDTETTGIQWWPTPHIPWYKPRVFSVQFSSGHYLDFQHSEDKLDDSHFAILNEKVFSNPNRYWFIQNAKFELHHLRNHGIEIKGKIHCTKQMARLMRSDEPSLKLEDLAQKYLKVGKTDIEAYFKGEEMSTTVYKWGSQKKEEWRHYEKLPLDKLIEYGIKDAILCRDLGLFQLKTFKEYSIYYRHPHIQIKNLIENEMKLTRTCFEMERRGIKIDRKYCEEAYFHEVQAYNAVKLELDKFSKETDWQSPQQLKEYFKSAGIDSYKFTEKGKMSFDRDALEQMDNEVAKLILKYRYHYKRAHTYFENFIWMADNDDILHADFQPAGTETGRMSCWNPNLQNIPKRRDKEEIDYKVRRCFIPREGKIFADFDYQAAEYRLMLDYAREMKLVEAVKNGTDVHEATRISLGIARRDDAKNLNFGLLYGMGVKKLAVSLKCTLNGAKTHLTNYFRELPNVSEFINSVRHYAQNRGYVIDWLGRLLFYKTATYPDNTVFKSPNGIIQGGVGDICKVAMNAVEELLSETKSSLLIQVHDSLLCEIDENERHLIDHIKQKMREAYPHKVLPMEVDAGFSAISWSDLQDEPPHVSLNLDGNSPT